MGFPSKNTGAGLPFPPPGYRPHPGIELKSPASPALAGRFFTTKPPGEYPNLPTYCLLFQVMVPVVCGTDLTEKIKWSPTIRACWVCRSYVGNCMQAGGGSQLTGLPHLLLGNSQIGQILFQVPRRTGREQWGEVAAPQPPVGTPQFTQPRSFHSTASVLRQCA